MRYRPLLPLAALALAAAACNSAPIDVGGLAPGGLADLIAHWSFDDATAGGMVRDESGNMRPGIIEGATPISGRFGGALHFQDAQQVVVRNFPNANPDWTVSAWTRPDAVQPGATDYVTLLSAEDPFKGGWEMNIVPITGMMRYHFGYYVGPTNNDYDYVECACVRPGVWTHVAAVVDGAAGTLSLYIDGELSGDPIPIRGLISPGNPDLFMGNWLNPTSPTPTRYLTGALDDVAVWRRALVPSEVRLLASMPAPNP